MIRPAEQSAWIVDLESHSGYFAYHFRRDQCADVSWRIVAQCRAGLLTKAEADMLLLAVYDATNRSPSCPTLKNRLLSAWFAVRAAVSREWTLLVAAWMYASANAKSMRKMSRERKCWDECSGSGAKQGK